MRVLISCVQDWVREEQQLADGFKAWLRTLPAGSTIHAEGIQRQFLRVLKVCPTAL